MSITNKYLNDTVQKFLKENDIHKYTDRIDLTLFQGLLEGFMKDKIKEEDIVKFLKNGAINQRDELITIDGHAGGKLVESIEGIKEREQNKDLNNRDDSISPVKKSKDDFTDDHKEGPKSAGRRRYSIKSK